MVELDKVISDIGSYDFKEKKELTEVDGKEISEIASENEKNCIKTP